MSRLHTFFLAFVAALTLLTTGCSDDLTQDFVYTYGIYDWESGDLFNDLGKIEEHIAGLGLPDSPVFITGQGKDESEARKDADAKARKEIDRWLALFRDEDFEALDLDPSTRFIWSVLDDRSTTRGAYEWNWEE